MHIIAITINLIAIIILSIGLFHDFKHPKHKAIFGYNVVWSMLLYVITISLTAIYQFIINRNLFGVILLLCAIMPFIIGKLVKFKTLKIYTIIQIFCFLISLITMLMII